MLLEVDFSVRRTRTLARISAYTLFALFLVNGLMAALVPGIGEPARALGFFSELLERSTVPLVAVLFLYLGMAGGAVPALWECRLALAIRPLLRLAVLLYILLAIAVVGLLSTHEANQTRQLDDQLKRSLEVLAELRRNIAAAQEPARLQQLLAGQPALLADPGDPTPEASRPLAEQQRRAQQRIERVEEGLRGEHRRRRSQLSQNESLQGIRLALNAFLYGLFYLLAAQIWPRSVAATVARVLELRQRRLAEDLQEEEELDEGEQKEDRVLADV